MCTNSRRRAKKLACVLVGVANGLVSTTMQRDFTSVVDKFVCESFWQSQFAMRISMHQIDTRHASGIWITWMISWSPTRCCGVSRNGGLILRGI